MGRPGRNTTTGLCGTRSGLDEPSGRGAQRGICPRTARAHTQGQRQEREGCGEGCQAAGLAPPAAGRRWSGLTPGSVQCVVTSAPPPVPADGSRTGRYVDAVREVFAQVRRALANSGVAWLHVPDSAGAETGLGWRVAFALQADGWILRNAIICQHTRCGRPADHAAPRRYTTVFLFARRRHYYFDLDKLRALFPAATSVCHDATSASRGRAATCVASGRPVRTGRLAQRPGAGALNPGDVWVLPECAWSSSSSSPSDSRGSAVLAARLPVSVAMSCIAAGCPAGGVVGDPFAGWAGTTARAARALGRGFVGVDGRAPSWRPACGSCAVTA